MGVLDDVAGSFSMRRFPRVYLAVLGWGGAFAGILRDGATWIVDCSCWVIGC